MSKHKKPTVFKGRTMNWDKMTAKSSGAMFSNYGSANGQDAKDDISHLLARLGDSDLLDMNYGCGGSGTHINDARSAFRALGYSANKIDYDIDRAINNIKANRPVYIRGDSHRKCFIWCWGTRGHAWVIDGYVHKTSTYTIRYTSTIRYRYMQYVYNVTKSYNQTYTNITKLVHNNFGWGGFTSGNNSGANSSGWYDKNLYDPNNGADETSDTFKSDKPYNYRYYHKMIVDIY